MEFVTFLNKYAINIKQIKIKIISQTSVIRLVGVLVRHLCLSGFFMNGQGHVNLSLNTP